jgi:hypothetical protein
MMPESLFLLRAPECLKTKSGMNMDVPHRWNATYDMLHEALEYKVALNKYAVEQYHVGPTELEWQKAESLHSFLRAFSEARKAFSTDRQLLHKTPLVSTRMTDTI